MKMNVKSPFLLASLLMGLLPLFQASANEQTRNEVRQALLSIQAELNEMEGRKGEAPPVPEISARCNPRTGSGTRAFPSTQHPGPNPNRPSISPELEAEESPIPAFLSRKQEVAQELQSVQEGLDQLNRQSGRFPPVPGLLQPILPKLLLPDPRLNPSRHPRASHPKRIGLPASFNRSKPPWMK